MTEIDFLVRIHGNTTIFDNNSLGAKFLDERKRFKKNINSEFS